MSTFQHQGFSVNLRQGPFEDIKHQFMTNHYLFVTNGSARLQEEDVTQSASTFTAILFWHFEFSKRQL